MIYLFTSDGYRETLNLDNYATTEQELIQLAQQYFEQYFSDLVITNCEVDFSKKIIKIRYYDMDFKDILDYTELCFIQIPKI